MSVHRKININYQTLFQINCRFRCKKNILKKLIKKKKTALQNVFLI